MIHFFMMEKKNQRVCVIYSLHFEITLKSSDTDWDTTECRRRCGPPKPFLFRSNPPLQPHRGFDLKKRNDLDKATWFCPWQKCSFFLFLNKPRGVKTPPVSFSLHQAPADWTDRLTALVNWSCLLKGIVCTSQDELDLAAQMKRVQAQRGCLWSFCNEVESAGSVIYSHSARFIRKVAGGAFKCTAVAQGFDEKLQTVSPTSRFTGCFHTFSMNEPVENHLGPI